MSRRVVMLGLDGVDRVLVQQWVAEGRLPVMRELFAESHKLMLDEANRPLPGGVWTDIATGASAAHHGYIHQQHCGSARTSGGASTRATSRWSRSTPR